ncbi:MAG TPA: DUF1501 domain-containing protein, partial [Gimesia maris]|nr:DUF1501 domain-containing protein [Gimesia maris]
MKTIRFESMHDSSFFSRRQLLQTGLGTAAGLALSNTLPAGQDLPHHPPAAKHVIMLYMSGGYS